MAIVFVLRTIRKLSSTLSCCEKFDSTKEVVVASVRRSLIYPVTFLAGILVENMVLIGKKAILGWA